MTRTLQNPLTIIRFSTSSLTEVLLTSHLRYTSHKIQEFIEQEIDGLLARKAFTFVPLCNILEDVNMLSYRIPMAIKNPSTGKERYKARFVVQ